MKLIRKENGDYHLLINGEIKSLQDFNITEEDCDILTLGYSAEKMAREKYPNNWSFADDFEDPLLIIGCSRSAYEKGFKAHQELVKDKLFTASRINIIREMLVEGALTDMSCSSAIVEYDKILQSLQKTEWEIELDEQGKISLL